MRFGDHPFADRVHLDVPSYGITIFGLADHVIVEAALPEPGRELIAKEIARQLLPLGYKFHQVRGGDLSFSEKMHMIGHDAECMHGKLHGFGDAFQGLDRNSAAIRILKNGTTAFATDSDKINPAANILVTRKTNLLARSNEHRTEMVAEKEIL